MRRILIISAILFLAAAFSEKSLTAVKGQERVRAPEFAKGLNWLNTSQPLSIAALKGKVVLLDFWTYGCINCIHIIPDLKKLEAKYPNQLVVIGVHSAKFDNEGETENIRQIILRYNLEHPVVNDADFQIWNSYDINAYPGLVLIDAEGFIVERWFGEGQFAEINKLVDEAVRDARQKGNLKEQPLKFVLEKSRIGDLPLAFPGKILADEKSKRLFISDSNHNRIVVTEFGGKLIETIGNAKETLTDGSYTSASFNRPQGLALDGNFLYVADMENHAIRKIDLSKKMVETISGSGRQAAFRSTGGNAKTSELSSPWDLAKIGNALYIAMAGTHQIWKLDFDKQTVAPFAGTGAEARLDGRITFSAFGQPTGITTDGKSLFVSDSETNVIREINLQKQTVETLAGGDLFVFGDADGAGDSVRLQHPLGVEFYNGNVLIADTYNHKIKILNPANQTVKTLFGTGDFGQTDGTSPTFYEPGGLSVADGKIFVADTNNHAVRVVDLKTKQVSTLKIEGLTPPPVASESESVLPNLSVIKFPAHEVSLKSENSLVFNFDFPAGYHLNSNAPNRYEVTLEDAERIKITSPKQKFNKLPLTVPFQALKKGTSVLKPKLTIYYCREDNTGVCLIKTFAWEIPVKIIAKKGAPKRIELNETLKVN